jgi:biofilm protein TabA
MIFDTLSNFKLYLAVHPLFAVVSEFINTHDLSMLPIGKHSISRGISMNINDYETADIKSKFIECHRKYIDLQIIQTGSESIGFCNREDCTVSEKYNDEKDLEKLDGQCVFFTLKKGLFCVFFPQDAHMPGLRLGNPKQSVKKIVFKIPV